MEYYELDPITGRYYKTTLPNTATKEDQSDIAAGLSHGLQSTKATALGAVGLGADTLNRTFDTDAFTGVRDWGIEGYQETMAGMEPEQREVYTAEGVEGIGDAVDFTQYWLGYGASNIASGLGIGAVGSSIAKMLAKKHIAREAKRLVAERVARGEIRDEVGEKARIEAMETAKLTQDWGRRGFIGGMGPQAFAQELGATYGEAVERAEREGKNIEDIDLGRVWGYGSLAGGAEFATDLLTAGALKVGPLKDAISKATSTRPVVGRAQRGLMASQAEGLTEVAQTGLEEMGAGASFEEANFSDPTSYFAGAIPGAAAGLIRGNRPIQDERPHDLLVADEINRYRMENTTPGNTVDMFGGGVGPTRMGEEDGAFVGPDYEYGKQMDLGPLDPAIDQEQDMFTAYEEDAMFERHAQDQQIDAFTQQQYMDSLAPNTQGSLFAGTRDDVPPSSPVTFEEEPAPVGLSAPSRSLRPDPEVGPPRRYPNVEPQSGEQLGLELGYQPQQDRAPTSSLQGVIEQNVGADRPGAFELRDQHSLLNQKTIEDPENPGTQIPNPMYDPLLGQGRQKVDEKRIKGRYSDVAAAAGERADIGPTGQVGPEPAALRDSETQTETPLDIGQRYEQIATGGIDVEMSKTDQKWYDSKVKGKSFEELDDLGIKTLSPKRREIIAAEMDRVEQQEVAVLTSQEQAPVEPARQQEPEKAAITTEGAGDATVVRVNREAAGIKEGTQQDKVLSVIEEAVNTGNVDQIVQKDGSVNMELIGRMAGLPPNKKGRVGDKVGKALTDVRKKLAKAGDTSLDELYQQVRDRLKSRRTGSVDEDPNQVVDEREIFGDENTTASMGVINSVGGSQSDVGQRGEEEIAYEEKLSAQIDTVGDTKKAQQQASRNAAVNAAAARIEELRTSPQTAQIYELAEAKWNEMAYGDIQWEDVPNDAKFDWFLDTVEYVNNPQMTDEEYEAEHANTLEKITDALFAVEGQTTSQDSGAVLEGQSRRLENDDGSEQRSIPPADIQEDSTATGPGNRRGKRKFSKTDGEQQGTTRARIEEVVYNLTGKTSNWRVKIYSTAQEAADDMARPVSELRQEQAWVESVDGAMRAFFIAENIPSGQELSVFLHEVGSHIGLDEMLPTAFYNRLVSKISEWANLNDDSFEFQIADRAIRRLTKASEISESRGVPLTDGDVTSELIAYFIEEAVRAGVTPQVLKQNTTFGRFIRDLYAYFKAAIRRLGLRNVDNLTAQNVVDLAYGAARISTSAKWHGTAASFRRFAHKYMGSGEGVQVYGWGTYIGDQKKTGQRYWEQDVKNKFGRAAAVGKASMAPHETTTLSFMDPFFFHELNMYMPKPKGGKQVQISGIDVVFLRAGAPIAKVRLPDGRTEHIPMHSIVRKDGIFGNSNKPYFRSETLDELAAELDAVGKDKGSLFTTDIAARDEELLVWEDQVGDHPVVLGMLETGITGELREAVQKEMMFDSFKNSIGFTIYDAIAAVARRNPVLIESRLTREQVDLANKMTGGGSRDLRNESRHEAMASMFLDNIGVKGIKFVDGWSRNKSAPEEQTHNYVVFDDRNIIISSRKPGGAKGRASRRFSIADTGSVYEPPTGTLEKVAKEIKYAYQSVADKAPALLSLHAIHDLYGDVLTKLQDYYHRVSEMENMQQAMQNAGHKVAVRWEKLKGHERAKLHYVMGEATSNKIHPDRPFTHESNTHLTVEGDPVQTSKNREKHRELSQKYNALSENAKSVYIDARNRLAEDWKLRREIYRELVGAAYDPQIEKATGDAKQKLIEEKEQHIRQNAKLLGQLKGPYFPLKRFGPHLVIYKSRALETAEKKVEGLVGDARRAAENTVDKMRKDKQHYWVQTFDSSRDARRLRDQTTGAVYKFAYDRDSRQKDITQQGFKRIANMLEDGMSQNNASREAIDSVKSMLADMYVRSLPEQSAIGREVERKGIGGYEKDMLRVFASTIESNAFYMSRLKYVPKITQELYDLRKQADEHGEARLQQAVNEVQKRHSLDMTFIDQPYQNAIARASGIFHLFSPSYWLVNATQPWFIGAPYLAARFGMGRTMSELRSGFVDAGIMVKNMIKEGGAFADIDVSSLSDTAEQEMLKYLIDKGRIDINVGHDLGVMSKGDRGLLSKTSRYAMWPAHQVETINRVMTALATYRMARSQGMDAKKATELADKTIIDTQIDYSNANAPRFMKHGAVPLGKLVFQFRKYQHAMVQLLMLNAKKAFAGDKTARATLGYMFGMQFVTAGLVGLPLYNVVELVANGLLDDDDEDGDARTQMYNALVDNVGKEMATLLVKGVPAVTLGTDLTKRTGMGDIFSPFPFLRTDGYTGQETLGNVLVALGGAPMSMGAAAIDAAKFADSGQWLRAVEVTLPKGFKDVLKAARYDDEGIASRSGVVGLPADSLSEWDITQRALGLTPTKESDYWDAKTAVRKFEKGLSSRKDRLRREFAEARADRDTAAMRRIRKEVREFNRDHPQHKISGSDLFRAYKDRKPPKTGEMNLGRGTEKMRELTRFAN